MSDFAVSMIALSLLFANVASLAYWVAYVTKPYKWCYLGVFFWFVGFVASAFILIVWLFALTIDALLKLRYVKIVDFLIKDRSKK